MRAGVRISKRLKHASLKYWKLLDMEQNAKFRITVISWCNVWLMESVSAYHHAPEWKVSVRITMLQNGKCQCVSPCSRMESVSAYHHAPEWKVSVRITMLQNIKEHSRKGYHIIWGSQSSHGIYLRE